MLVEKMRTNRSLLAVACLAIAIIASILSLPASAKKRTNETTGTPGTSNPVEFTTDTCGTTSWDLTAGQTIDVGTVTVSNDANNLYVTYTLDDPDYVNACFGTLHLWVGNDLSLMPATPQGSPIPGQFPYHFTATGLKTYTFQIPFSALNLTNATEACGTKLYVVTHAEVDLDCSDSNTGHETAFGGPNPGGGPRWWFYGQYTVCCEFGPPQPPVCETAFAKGGYVWTTDRKSNPEGLPSLNLTKNRWGWAINLTAPGVTTYDIWAGAGLNNTGNGQKVGTLTINWDGSNAVVTYTMFSGFYLGEVHLYAGDGSPTTIAPGQYGYTDSFNPNRTTYTFNVPLCDTNGTGGVWIVAHAVVCNR
jgi:hypothetical protein